MEIGTGRLETLLSLKCCSAVPLSIMRATKKISWKISLQLQLKLPVGTNKRGDAISSYDRIMFYLGIICVDMTFYNLSFLILFQMSMFHSQDLPQILVVLVVGQIYRKVTFIQFYCFNLFGSKNVQIILKHLVTLVACVYFIFNENYQYICYVKTKLYNGEVMSFNILIP